MTPLVTTAQIVAFQQDQMANGGIDPEYRIRDLYEADRAASRLLIEKLVKALEENNDSLRVAITSEDPHVGESLGMQLDENNEVLAEANAFLKP